MPHRVTAIVVSRNSAADLPGCLSSLQSQTWPELDTIVVDNASIDNSLDLVAEAGGHARAVGLPANTGFAAANNAGLAVAGGEYVLFVNPDARLAPNFVELLVAALEANPKAGSACGKLYKEPDGPLDSTGILLGRARLQPLDRGEGEIDQGQYDASSGGREIMGATAAAAMYRREALNQLAPDGEAFDEDFFAYYEDVDLAWRAAGLGWRCLYVPEAVGFHSRRGPGAHGLEIRRRADINRLWLFVKNETWTWIEFFTVLPRQVAWEALRTISRAIDDPGYLTALMRSLAMLPLMLRKRRLIFATRRSA